MKEFDTEIAPDFALGANKVDQARGGATTAPDVDELTPAERADILVHQL